MFDTKEYISGSGWTVKLSEILRIDWDIKEGGEKALRLSTKSGHRYLYYACYEDRNTIETLKDIIGYTYDLPG